MSINYTKFGLRITQGTLWVASVLVLTAGTNMIWLYSGAEQYWEALGVVAVMAGGITGMGVLTFIIEDDIKEMN